MPDTTPSGELGADLLASQVSLSNSTTFQTWTSSAGVVAAAAKVLEYHVDEDDAPDQFVLIHPFTGWKRDRQTLGVIYMTAPVLIWHFEELVPSGYSVRNSLVNLMNNVGAIMAECEAQSNTADFFDIAAWSIVEGDPLRTGQSAKVQRTMCRVRVEGAPR